MNIGVLLKKSLPVSEYSEREVLRYAGVKDAGGSALPLVYECEKEISGELKNTVVYRILPVSIDGDICDFGSVRVKSRHLSNALRNSEYAVVMAATLGVGADRLIYKYSHINTAKAHMLDAVATERIETLCDKFCRELNSDFRGNNLECGFRFSPGYGDLPLEFQREIFSILEPHKHIGLTLNESLMMSPSKSVSAVLALKPIGKDVK